MNLRCSAPPSWGGGHQALMAVVSVRLSVPGPKSRMEGRSKLKGSPWHGWPWPYSEVESSRSPGGLSTPWPISHIFVKGRPKNFKLGIRQEYDDLALPMWWPAHNGTRRPASLTCAVTSKLKAVGGCSSPLAGGRLYCGGLITGRTAFLFICTNMLHCLVVK